MRRIILTTTLTTTLTTFALLLAPLALAQGPGAGPGARGDRGARLTQLLDLTADQQAALAELRDAHQAEVAVFHEQVRTASDRLRALWRANNPDRAAILALTQQVNTAKLALQLKRVDHLFAVRQILSPDQFQRFLDHTGPRRALDGRRGRRGGGPGMVPGGRGRGDGQGYGGRGYGGRGYGACDGTGPCTWGTDAP